MSYSETLKAVVESWGLLLAFVAVMVYLLKK